MSKTGVDACRQRVKLARGYLAAIDGQGQKVIKKTREAQEKIQKQNDPEEIKKNELARIYQLKSDVETETGIFVAQNCKKLKQQIYDFLTDRIGRKTSYSVVEERINLCLELLKEYRKVVENETIIEKAQSRDYTLYGQLFNMLIEYNANFLMFAPKECFKKTKVSSKIRTLPELYQNMVNERIERFEENDKADYVNESEIYESESNEKTERVEEMMTFLNNTKEQAVDKMEDMADEHSNRLYRFISNEYQEIKGKNGIVTSEDIKTIFNRCKDQRERLIDLVKNNEFVSKRMKKRDVNPNENMFNHLINLDIRFAQYAPGKCYCRLDLDFKTLTEAEKDVVFDRICRYGLWNIPQFVENYHDVFACQIVKRGNTLNQ